MISIILQTVGVILVGMVILAVMYYTFGRSDDDDGFAW